MPGFYDPYSFFSKEDTANAIFPCYCNDLGVSPKLLSEMTDIPEERICEISSAKVVPNAIEIRKIARAIGYEDIDHLDDRRWRKLDKKYEAIESEIDQMVLAFDAHISRYGDFGKLTGELKKKARKLGIADCCIAYPDVLSCVPHSIMSGIKDSNDAYWYMYARLVNVAFSPSGDDYNQRVLYVDSRDYAYVNQAIRDIVIFAESCDDPYEVIPTVDVTVYVYDAENERIKKEILVFHGQKNMLWESLAENKEKKEFYDEFLEKVYRSGYRFLEAEDIFSKDF